MADNSTRLKLLRSFSLTGLILSFVACIFVLTSSLQAQENGTIDTSYTWTLVLLILGVVSLLFLILSLGLMLLATTLKSQAQIEGLLEFKTAVACIFMLFLILLIIGAIFWISASPAIYGPVYPIWMIPFFAWLTVLSLLVLIYLVLLRTGSSLNKLVTLVLLLVILIAGIVVYLQFWNYGSPRKEDIYYTYLDGQRLLNGINPYERILSGNMQVNDKYSTYLPVFYYLSWGAQAAGLTAFGDWLSFWRVVFLVFNLLIASLLFYIPAKSNLIALSVFASLFWLFNRWTLHVGKTGDIDFVAIFFMLLSLALFQRNRLLSYLLIGISLGLKQMGIFLIPLYLIWAWNEQEIHYWKNLVKAVFWIACIPVLVSLPFLVWNWEGYVRSILFSATRLAMVGYDVYSLDYVLGLNGALARLPLLVMLLLVYWVTWKRDVRLYLPALLVMAVFVFFNTVMFTSYMVWIIPLIPLVARDYLVQSKLARTNPS
jgi:hypothetical protein